MAHTKYAEYIAAHTTSTVRRISRVRKTELEKERRRERQYPCYYTRTHRYKVIETTFKGTTACCCVDFIIVSQSCSLRLQNTDQH